MWDPDQERKLRTHRLWAGFTSAKRAALALGWPVGTYVSHETGRRSADPKTIEKYLAAFESVAKDRNHEHGKGRAQRLLIARTLRAYGTAGEAIAKFGWRRATYYAHESGSNKIGPRQAEVYAAAFDVSDAWLLEGTLPSGMGAEVDQHLARGEGVQTLLRFASADYEPRSAPKSLSALSFEQVSIGGRDAVVVRESPWSKDALKLSRALPTGPVWVFDAELVKEVWRADSSALRLLVVNSDRLEGFARSGDRLLVDVLDRRWRPDESFVASDPGDRLSLARSSADAILGRVVLRLVRP